MPTLWPNNSTCTWSLYHSSKIELRRMITCVRINTSPRRFTAKSYEQHKYPSTGEWINKLWYLHIMEWLRKEKERKQPLKQGATWMDLENLENTLSKTRHHSKTCTMLIPFIYGAQEQENWFMSTEISDNCGGVETDCRGARETFWGHGNALHFVFCGNQRDVNNYQNSLTKKMKNCLFHRT